MGDKKNWRAPGSMWTWTRKGRFTVMDRGSRDKAMQDEKAYCLMWVFVHGRDGMQEIVLGWLYQMEWFWGIVLGVDRTRPLLWKDTPCWQDNTKNSTYHRKGRATCRQHTRSISTFNNKVQRTSCWFWTHLEKEATEKSSVISSPALPAKLVIPVDDRMAGHKWEQEPLWVQDRGLRRKGAEKDIRLH